MHDISMDSPPQPFSEMWVAAGTHLNAQAATPLSWIRAHLTPPFLEHLSFRLGNQLFFVHVMDIAGVVSAPGALTGLHRVARGCAGVPCLMPMRYTAGSWEPVNPGWGLVHAETRDPVTPHLLASDSRIEMTDWEVHDFAVQVVRDHLRTQGRAIMSFQSDPDVDPSLWFIGDAGPEWVVVRFARYPTKKAAKPANWDRIAREAGRLSSRGNFASVSFANPDQEFERAAPPAPLWRGTGLIIAYEGLEPMKGA